MKYILLIVLLTLGCGSNYELSPPFEGEKITIKIASFNILGLPLIDKTKRMEQIAEKLREYDIVGVQEAWTKKSRNILSKDWAYVALGNVSGLPRYGDGLMILSKYPIIDSGYMSYDGAFYVERLFSRKGAMIATIEIGNFMINFFTTHLQSQKGKSRDRLRRSQLVQFLMYMHPGTSPKIITGDFNIQSKKKVVSTVLNAKDVMCSKNPHIDYILYRENAHIGITTSIQRVNYLSDHPIIEAEFTFKQKKAWN